MTPEQTAAIERWHKRNHAVADEKIEALLESPLLCRLKQHPLVPNDILLRCADYVNACDGEVKAVLMPIFVAAEERRFFADLAMKEMHESRCADMANSCQSATPVPEKYKSPEFPYPPGMPTDAEKIAYEELRKKHKSFYE